MARSKAERASAGQGPETGGQRRRGGLWPACPGGCLPPHAVDGQRTRTEEQSALTAPSPG